MTLQTAETTAPSIADVMALFDRMPAEARDRIIAACSSRGGRV